MNSSSFVLSTSLALIVAVAGCAESAPQAPAATAKTPKTVAKPKARKAPTDKGGELLFVAGGSFQFTFTVGKSSVRSQKTVTIPSFWLDRTEVTVAAYGKCLAEGVCEDAANERPDCNAGNPKRGSNPVNCVNWEMASGFCRWAGKTLPSEEQWEYAATAGSEQRLYPWGKTPPGKLICWKRWSSPSPGFPEGGCNSDDGCEDTGSCAVGTYKLDTSRDGILDLGGNVTEWTSTVFTTKFGKMVAARGGSWQDGISPDDAKSLARHEVQASRYERANPQVGFRCALDASDSDEQ